jgi:hypothetical protein
MSEQVGGLGDGEDHDQIEEQFRPGRSGFGGRVGHGGVPPSIQRAKTSTAPLAMPRRRASTRP